MHLDAAKAVPAVGGSKFPHASVFGAFVFLFFS